jgi:4-amino-4-deoxy-L-arabinose transferase-like glycosyltransferase
MKPWFVWLTLALIVAQFCVRDLPWHLDDYDQAKQAYVSFEIVELGHWWFQHTPRQAIATKPPLAGWISAGIHFVTRSWEAAWRLPSLVSALIMLVMLWRAGIQIASEQKNVHAPDQEILAARFASGGLLAASAFALNGMAPRLATLVRTDMMLTLFIFLIGCVIFEKIRADQIWSTRERWILCALVLCSMMTKGPIAYAFLLPGLLAFGFLCRRFGFANRAWSGWWSWFAPLLIFAAWVGVGIWHSREFYEQVVLKEFLGRFDMSDAPVHKHQPIYFYLAKLLLMFAPWSWLLIGLPFLKNIRAELRKNPAMLWLVCWALGGLIFMSFVPSKRADRIFPVTPPLCLLLVYFFKAIPSERFWRWPARTWAYVAIFLGLIFSWSYTAQKIVEGYHSHESVLKDFGERVRQTCAEHGWRYGLCDLRDEGMLLYLRQPLLLNDEVKKWKHREVDALVFPSSEFKIKSADFRPCRVLFESAKAPDKSSQYVLIVRSDGQQPPPSTPAAAPSAP